MFASLSLVETPPLRWRRSGWWWLRLCGASLSVCSVSESPSGGRDGARWRRKPCFGVLICDPPRLRAALAAAAAEAQRAADCIACACSSLICSKVETTPGNCSSNSSRHMAMSSSASSSGRVVRSSSGHTSCSSWRWRGSPMRVFQKSIGKSTGSTSSVMMKKARSFPKKMSIVRCCSAFSSMGAGMTELLTVPWQRSKRGFIMNCPEGCSVVISSPSLLSTSR